MNLVENLPVITLLITSVLVLLIISSGVAVAARHLRLPYTVGLVLIGLVMAFFAPVLFTGDTTIYLKQLLDISKNPILPEIILGLLVPPLVFEAAFHIKRDDLQRDFWLITLFAIPGVVITTVLVGVMVSWGSVIIPTVAIIQLPVAMVFGALVSATDPVSVVALFRSLGAPKRLQVLLEGESLFNDGTAIVMFYIMLAFAGVTGLHGFEGEQVNLLTGIANFIRVAGGGAIVGVVLGIIVSQLISRIDDPLVETTLTTVLAFGSYLVAEQLHFSGVLAVVAAGIVNGNVGPKGMSPTTRLVVFNFWEYLAFVANSIIFLLIGMTIDLHLLFSNWQAIAISILAVLLARAVSIYGFSIFGRGIPTKWKHVMFWGGLRGAITLALALSIPSVSAVGEQRFLLQSMAFGVVLFTLLVQGFSMDGLVKRLKLIQKTPMQDEYERRHARFVAGRAAYDYLQRMSRQGIISEHTWQILSKVLERQNSMLVDAVREVIASDPTVEAEELDTARRETLRAQRSALSGLQRDGVISDETYTYLVNEIDTALTEQHLNWPELLRGGISTLRVQRLMAVVIQEQDFENAASGLSNLGFSVARLPSTGGFLSRRNVTLLIGIQEGREAAAVRVLQNSCKKRLEYLSQPMKNLPLPLSAPIPITIGGATIFTFEVESYDEF
ncbi:MAG: Na+/H+ antiporter [Chloroflexi bacterium GWB2_49_20]|nr:MAG: Na+/H+ antiporter [Chloroflexi bacterium GWB2_49_20]OGN77161.1 MAG: Na+/H+ antiporter [Chloroflexi bacterium GWC2_49_37]OGN83887.1 MAG: Na+/H+ antiporter [Chloroflexi bacterium GWD2_49_16]